MRAIALENGRLRYSEDFEKPVPNQGESLIKVKMSTVCNLDKLLINGYSNFNGVLGHEFVGVVEESTGRPELVGKRVVADIRLHCGSCQHCLAGKHELCTSRREIGFLDKDGCFAEYMTAPDDNLYILPDSVPDEYAIFVEAMSVCMGLVKKCDVKPGSSVALVGDLRALYFTSMILNRMGAKVTVFGKDMERMKFLSRFADVAVAINGNYDNVIEQSGEYEGLVTALKLVNYGGKIVVNSIYTGQHTAINLSSITMKEISVIGCRTGLYQEAIDFMSEGLFVSPEIEQFGMERCQEAFESDCLCPVFVI